MPDERAELASRRVWGGVALLAAGVIALWWRAHRRSQADPARQLEPVNLGVTNAEESEQSQKTATNSGSLAPRALFPSSPTDGSMPSKPRSKKQNLKPLQQFPYNNNKLVIAMVGLPARGKSFVSKKVQRYLLSTGNEAKVFNAGQYRRQAHKAGSVESEMAADFFNNLNPESAALREEFAMAALEDLLEYVHEGDGKVGIHDATNSSVKRRQKLVQRCKKAGTPVLFIESCCTDPVVIRRNIELKASGPDYCNMDRDAAIEDFTRRLGLYEADYKAITDEEHVSYIKINNTGNEVEAHGIQGYIASQIMFFLMNIHLTERPIYLATTGEWSKGDGQTDCSFEDDGRLTSRGEMYSQALHDYYLGQAPVLEEWARNQSRASAITPLLKNPSNAQSGGGDVKQKPLSFIWTSTLKASKETAQFLPLRPPRIELRALNRIKVGKCAGLSVDEFKDEYPQEFSMRENDRLNFRFPEGESYLDLAQRLQPAIIELERLKSPVVIISHRSVLRVLRSYFTGISMDDMPYVQFPQHSVCKLSMGPQGVKEEMTQLLPDETPPQLSLSLGSRRSRNGSVGSCEDPRSFKADKAALIDTPPRSSADTGVGVERLLESPGEKPRSESDDESARYRS